MVSIIRQMVTQAEGTFNSSLDSATDFAGRLNAHFGADCLNFLRSIPEKIGQFFTHAFANVCMYKNAWSSIGGTVSTQDIQQRVQEIRLFNQQIANGDQPNALMSYNVLSFESRNLLYYTDAWSVAQFSRETNPTRAAAMRAEIIREGEWAISFQNQLMHVNAFYQGFMSRFRQQNNNQGPVTSRLGPVSTIPGGATTLVAIPPTVIPAPIPGAVPGTIQLPQYTIPNQLMTDFQREYRARLANPALPQNPAIAPVQQYILGHLPLEVQERAQQIALLKQAYVSDLAFPDDDFSDYMDIMEVPVFDSSHPAVLGAIGLATGATTDALNNRDLRHEVDLSVFINEYLVKRESGSRICCANCRHPAVINGNRPANILVDVDLQIRILNFLRSRVNPGSTTTT